MAAVCKTVGPMTAGAVPRWLGDSDWLASRPGLRRARMHQNPESRRPELCRAITRIMALSWCFLCPLGCSSVLVNQPMDDLPALDPGGHIDRLAGFVQRRVVVAAAGAADAGCSCRAYSVRVRRRCCPP